MVYKVVFTAEGPLIFCDWGVSIISHPFNNCFYTLIFCNLLGLIKALYLIIHTKDVRVVIKILEPQNIAYKL